MNATNLKLMVCFMASMLAASASTAMNAPVIYGQDNARHFTASRQGPFFVQAGAFQSKQFAQQLRAKLAASTHYPVQIRVVGKYHSVVIGPLPSIEAVRAIGGVRAAEVAKRAPVMVQKTPTTMAPTPPSVQRTPTVIKTYPFKSLPPSINNGVANHWFVAADFSFLKANSKNEMTVQNGSDFPSPLDVDQYSVNHQNKPQMVGAQLGYRWERNNAWLPANNLALRYQHLFTSDISGNITQYSLPEFNNYSYRWSVDANVISLYSKVDLLKYKRILPYVDASLGLSMNHSRHYSETAFFGVTPRISPAFETRTSTQFSYSIGTGLDVILTPKLLFSVGYDYQQFGHMISGQGQTTWSSVHLDQGSSTSNMGSLGITYLIDDSLFETSH